jgi:hypothetical protein
MKLRGMGLILALAIVLLAAVQAGAEEDKFVPGCTLPYATVAEKREIDQRCPHEGKANTEAHRAQNRAKNELCATGAPITLPHQTFKALQKRAEDLNIPFGSSNKIPPNRSVLRDIYTLPNGRKIGEGSVVRYVGRCGSPAISFSMPATARARGTATR